MRGWHLVTELVVRAFPAVDRRLARYLELVDRAAAGPEHAAAGREGKAATGRESTVAGSEDAAQARLSVQTKRFHCQGAAAFGCLTPLREPLWDAIVALQTMSDYLDNLCDRAGAAAEARFRRLHDSMRSAVEPPLPSPGEYRQEVLTDERNAAVTGAVGDALLRTLTDDCRRSLAVLPSYRAVQAAVQRLIDLYCDLQSYKHLPPGRREAALAAWHARWAERPGFVGEAARQLAWHEFAAASGSTLGVFALFRLGAVPGVAAQQAETVAPEPETLVPEAEAAVPEAGPHVPEADAVAPQVEAVLRAYFPYICGLHILLDYLIDVEEDLASDDLNFVTPYRTWERVRSGLNRFTRRALEAAASLPDAWFHRTVVKGLLALYLSDPKVRREPLEETSCRLIREAGPPTATLCRLCRHLRHRGVVPPSWQPARVPAPKGTPGRQADPAAGLGTLSARAGDPHVGPAAAPSTGAGGEDPRWKGGT